VEIRPPAAAVLLALLAAGCASTGEATATAAFVSGAEPVPAVLVGVPAAVIVDRALVDLGSGDPFRVARARAVLLALPPEEIEPVRSLARAGIPGSEPRLGALAVLAERGEPLDDWAASEVVEMTLREIETDEAGGRAALLGVARLRSMGDCARAALRTAREPGGPRAALADRLLALLGPARDLPGARP
jgi:hypothetical protein